MRPYLKDMCDAVIGSLESQSEDFQEHVREVFCKMDEAYKLTGLNDTKRAEKLSQECRYILLILRLFPIELQLAMNNLYKKTLWGFVSIYLDFKMMLIDKQSNKETYFDDVMKEIFCLLGSEDKTCIWSVVVTSHTLNRIEILKRLASYCIDATKESAYEHEQYIRMIWVLHVFFSQCKKAQTSPDVSAKVLETALKLKQPKGLCKWMCHHFPGYGWKGLTDANVHEALVSEKQPKTFFKQVYQAISKDDTLKYQFQFDAVTNGVRDEDSSSQSSESLAQKKNDTPSDKVTKSPKKKPEGEELSDTIQPPNEETSASADDKSNNRDKQDTNVDANHDKDKPLDSLDKSPKDKKLEESSKKSESSSKPTKTLGPGRTKPITTSSFLDDDEDTVDMEPDTDNESDDIKQANKENKKSDDTPTEDVKKDKSNANRSKRNVESSDENDVDSKSKSKRIKPNQDKKAPKILSDSETDVEDVVDTKGKTKKETTKRTRASKRKADDDSNDSDNTIAESDCTDIVESNTNGRRGNKKSTNSRSQAKKPQPKKMKADSVKVDDGDKPSPPSNMPYADDDDLIRIIEEYHKGPYAYIFEEFEESKQTRGAEPFIELSPIPSIACETEKESTLADILHNNKQKVKEQKQPQRKRKNRK